MVGWWWLMGWWATSISGHHWMVICSTWKPVASFSCADRVWLGPRKPTFLVGSRSGVVLIGINWLKNHPDMVLYVLYVLYYLRLGIIHVIHVIGSSKSCSSRHGEGTGRHCSSSGHLRNLNWRYRFHIFWAYFWGLNFREYPHQIWPKIWY